MIKRLIFDLDNTLIEWKDEYDVVPNSLIKEYNLNITSKQFNDVVLQYESYYNVIKKEYFRDLFNLLLNLNIDINFIDNWLNKLSEMSEYNKDIEDTIKYLSSKYDLVILTNWFEESQRNRLKKARIDKYFSHIYSGEDCIKPSVNSFKKAMGDYNINECIMIGDNYSIDIEVPISLGMKVIQVDLKNRLDKKNYLINDIKELKEIL